MTRRRWMLVTAALAFAAPAFGESPPPSASADRGGHFEQRVHEMRSRVLRERIGLTEDKARKVEAILDRYAPERRRVATRMREALKKLRALTASNSDDQAAYRGALGQVRASRKALQELMDRAFTEVAKELTPREQVRLFLALDDLRGKAAEHRQDDDD